MTSTTAGGPAIDEMFEEMYGLPPSEAPPSNKKRGVLGGAMFVDESRGAFFQRRLANVADAKREMTEGLSEVAMSERESDGAYEASTSMPSGSWEVRLVEVDGAALTVTFGAAENKPEDLDDVHVHESSLRCVRTFELPADADFASSALEVKLDEERSMVSLTVPKVRGVAMTGSMDKSAAVVEESTPPNTPPHSPRVAKCKSGKAAKRRAAGRTKRSGLRAGFLNAKPQRRVSFEQEPGQSMAADENVVVPTGAE